jgi:FkbM family methyltransferase
MYFYYIFFLSACFIITLLFIYPRGNTYLQKKETYVYDPLTNVIQGVDGYKYYIKNDKDYIQSLLVSGEQFNKSLITYIKDIVTTEDIVFIVGAHIGTTAIPLAGYVNGIHAFEPSPDSYTHLVDNIKLNNLSNIHPYKIALGCKEDTGYMLDTQHDRIKTNTGGNHVIVEEDILNKRRSSDLVDTNITIKVTTLDIFCGKHDIQRIDVLIIDIEGMEEDFLVGAINSLRRYQPRMIICEVWNNSKRELENMSTSEENIIDLFEQLNYVIHARNNDDIIFVRR